MNKECENQNVLSKDMRAEVPPIWSQINWVRAERYVRHLQERIVKAQKEKRYAKVKSLSRILTRSFHAKALAVRQVTRSKGSRTAGIDGIIWRSHESKAQAILELQQYRYRANALKRRYILKANGKKRPLGIPTMKDRAMQALYALALYPVAETTADTHSYGFRPFRSCQDAIDQIGKLMYRKKRPEWILEGDIKGCFDNISHTWIMEHIPIEKKILKEWLKCGYLEGKELFATDRGTPQGGVISPIIANMVLDGLEGTIYAMYKTEKVINGHTQWTTVHQENPPRVNFVRYADDFIITGASPVILNEIMPVIKRFFQERGLTLSEEKTVITHIETGFDFLGFNIRSYKGQVIMKPSKNKISRFQENLSSTIKKCRGKPAEYLISKLNPILRGWSNYYRFVASKRIFSQISHWLFARIWRWAKREHPRKKACWIKQNYFTNIGKRNWVFFSQGEKGTSYLFELEHVKIKRYVKIKSKANPFSKEDAGYFAKRKKRR